MHATLSSSKHKSAGLTLIELVITLAIFSIVLLAGVPAFSEARDRSQLRAATYELASSLRWARAEARRTNQRAVVTIGDGARCSNGEPSAVRIQVGPAVVRCLEATEFSARFARVDSLSTSVVTFGANGLLVGAATALSVVGKGNGLSKGLSIEASGRVFELTGNNA
jgi:prepilin-type N-terminal cleavage/methylation domain-containing protein